jgi:hypothetical protein
LGTIQTDYRKRKRLPIVTSEYELRSHRLFRRHFCDQNSMIPSSHAAQKTGVGSCFTKNPTANGQSGRSCCSLEILRADYHIIESLSLIKVDGARHKLLKHTNRTTLWTTTLPLHLFLSIFQEGHPAFSEFSSVPSLSLSLASSIE